MNTDRGTDRGCPINSSLEVAENLADECNTAGSLERKVPSKTSDSKQFIEEEDADSGNRQAIAVKDEKQQGSPPNENRVLPNLQ